MNVNYDIVVIGGGPAGLAAAIEARKAGVQDILILERDMRLGGILLQCIHNGFGLHHFGEELTGPEYAGRFIDEVNALHIDYKIDTMVLEITDKTVTAINTSDGLLQINAHAIILAMGCRERTRGALVLPGTRPAGIFTAGAVQRFVNIDGYMCGKKAVILGSGDIGLIMARRLTLEGAEIKMICEVMPFSSGLQRNIVQCVENFNIPLRFNYTITEIHGERRVEGVTICAVDKNRKPILDTAEFISCDMVLLSVGLIPENELSQKCNIAIDGSTGGAIVSEKMETSQGGIFSCGNAVHVHDLVDFVSAESIRAGRSAAEYVLSGAKIQTEMQHIPVRAGNRVRYTVPQFFESTKSDVNIPLLFRSTDVYRDVTLVVYSNNQRIKSIKKKIVRPGEMLSIELTPEQIEKIQHTVTVSIEIPEEDID